MSTAAAVQAAIFQLTGLQASPFALNSRYLGIDTATFTTATGQTIAYLRRRFVPPQSVFAPIGQHTVAQGERLDNIAWKFLGDPELFWRLSDANGAMRPEELEQVGRVLTITLPQGVPAVPSA
jgi:hypothetical protein